MPCLPCADSSCCKIEAKSGQERLKRKRLLVTCVALVVFDGLVGVALRIVEDTSNQQASSFFSGGVADILYLACARWFLMLCSAAAGYWAWKRVQPPPASHAANTGSEVSAVSLPGLGGSGVSSDSLLYVDSGASSETTNGSFMFTMDSLEEEKQRVERSKNGEFHRNIAVAALFVVCSLSALYYGVKCVSFGSSNAFDKSGSLLTALIGLGVFLCHFEFYMVKKLLLTWTTTEGLTFPWLHPHTLHFVPKADARMCQTCRAKIRMDNHKGMAYFCPLCERHYYCIACLKRQLRQRQASSSASSGNGISDAELMAAGSQGRSTWAYLRRVLPLVKPLLHLVIFCLMMVGTNQVFRLAMPHWQGKLLDAISKGDATSFQKSVIMYLIINIGSGLFSSVQQSTVLLVMRRLAFRTRIMVFKHILRQDIAYFDANLSGQITSRLTNDAQQMTDPVSLIMNNLLSNTILLLGGIFMCFQTSWKLSILAMTAIFPITFLVRTYSEWAGKISRKVMDQMSDANGNATQAIQNIRTVRNFGAENYELGRYEANLVNIYKLQLKDSLARIANSTFTSYLDLGVGVFVLWYGGSVIIAGDQTHFSLGQLITFQLYWNMMKNAFNGLNDVLSSLLRATSASQRILDLLDLRPTIESEEGVSLDDEQVIEGTISFSDVVFDYTQKRTQKPVLNNIRLEFLGGQVTAIVGKSGSGKSTIASLLLRLYDPISGSITLDGKEYRSFQPQSLRAQFGVVAQETQLFAGTIEENVAYASRKPYSREDLETAALRANALEFIQKCEDGFHTLVGERGVLLSGGQKQRVSIARMFLRQPRLLLLDEATSALDAENEALVQKALDDLVASGICRTVVVIAHRLSTIRNADQIVVMEEGEVKELGTHDQLLENSEGIYSQLVHRQLHGKNVEDTDDGSKGKHEKGKSRKR